MDAAETSTTLVFSGEPTLEERTEAHELIERLNRLVAEIQATQFPTLGVVEVVEDGLAKSLLVCPYCRQTTPADDVVAVDISLRESLGDADGIDSADERVVFDYSNVDEHFDGLYYRVACCDRPVGAPIGWQFA